MTDSPKEQHPGRPADHLALSGNSHLHEPQGTGGRPDGNPSKQLEHQQCRRSVTKNQCPKQYEILTTPITSLRCTGDPECCCHHDGLKATQHAIDLPEWQQEMCGTKQQRYSHGCEKNQFVLFRQVRKTRVNCRKSQHADRCRNCHEAAAGSNAPD